MKLIYVGDPMCSWCYGFGKELTALASRHPNLPLDIVVGGLRAGATDLLDDEGKRFRLSHWELVHAASGLPFNRAGLLARENFVYDTEPICRAVVVTRIIAPGADLLAVFRAMQHGFYVDAADTTDGSVLARLAVDALALQGFSIEYEAFFALWSSADAVTATQTDFRRARALRVRSFPSLLLEMDGSMQLISAGYAPVDELDQKLQSVLPTRSALP